MKKKVTEKKINTSNEFELCYIRHKYLRKLTKTPKEKDMAPYYWIVDNISKNTFFTYKNLFQLVGFESEDLVNIGKIHLVSFLGLFSLESMPERYKSFVSTFSRVEIKNPKENDILNKNKADFTMFLKQRMEDVVRVCRQKARNIKGGLTEEYHVFYGPNKPPKLLEGLVDNYEKMGFKKMDLASFRAVRKKTKFPHSNIIKFGKNYYICVPIDQKNLNVADFAGADMDPNDNIHNMTPEKIFFGVEEKGYWEDKQVEFDSYSRNKKVRTIRRFIESNSSNSSYKEELRAARKLLRSMGAPLV